jgi:hypothetical protein
MRVYCEHGAVNERLRRFQTEGRIVLVGFPYDPNSRSRAIRTLASPSRAQIGDLNIPIGEMKFPIGEMVGSEKHSEIERIVGRGNRCACFFTRDPSDILAKRTELEALLRLRFFHPDDDWDRFVDFLKATEDA